MEKQLIENLGEKLKAVDDMIRKSNLHWIGISDEQGIKMKEIFENIIT
jgi:hypothetical protein